MPEATEVQVPEVPTEVQVIECVGTGWTLIGRGNAMPWKISADIRRPNLGGAGSRRSNLFPESREELFEHDLVIVGDVAASSFEAEQLTWLREYVGTQGGGLILIDGAREHFHRRGTDVRIVVFEVCSTEGSQRAIRSGLAF